MRSYYNFNDKTAINLFALHIYAFQNMIRFNTKFEMNTPVGNNELSNGIKNRIISFKGKCEKIEYYQGCYSKINIDELERGSVFYFDPPYFITKAEYNDGKRGLEGWNPEKEINLLEYLSKLDRKGFKFMLSNVLHHNGNEHTILLDWIKKNNYKKINIGETGKKYPRKEVLILNYETT